MGGGEGGGGWGIEIRVSHHGLNFSLKYFKLTPGRGAGGGGGVGKLMKVSHSGLVWCPRTLPFHVESRHQNKLNSMIFQYTSMAN